MAGEKEAFLLSTLVLCSASTGMTIDVYKYCGSRRHEKACLDALRR